MKIAILGGGYTGLTAAYYLKKSNHEVHIFERLPTLGGLASGFNPGNWEWPLERAYHHLFASDEDILDFAKEIGFSKIFFRAPHTDSLYKVGDNYRIFPLDTPQDFMRFPLLTFSEKIRAAFVIAFLRFSPHLKIYEKTTAKNFLTKTMGKKCWQVLWEQLFRKKFGNYAENVLMSFFWARISKRTKKLGYMEGGFQAFTDFLENRVESMGTKIHKNTVIKKISKNEGGYRLETEGSDETFNTIVSTLPTPVLASLTKEMFPENYHQKLNKLKYLNALVLILETRAPILKSTYWLNISSPDIPMMFVGQHTNFVDPRHYGQANIAYIGYYLKEDDKLITMSKEELIEYLKPHLQNISGTDLNISSSYLWKAPYAQPIFDADFAINKPDFKTPLDNFYVANLDMTYPYDRGTNYAVALGKKVAMMI